MGDYKQWHWLPEELVKHCVDIGSSSSTCMNCGKGAFPEDTVHNRVAGYGPAGRVGCGTEFKYYYCGYIWKTPGQENYGDVADMFKKNIGKWYPHLTWIEEVR